MAMPSIAASTLHDPQTVYINPNEDLILSSIIISHKAAYHAFSQYFVLRWITVSHRTLGAIDVEILRL
jgi:hypothetical protein